MSTIHPHEAIFRKVALDRLASPEQLDQLMPVTDARGWIGLGSAAVVLLAVALWSITGSLPQNVRGTGILVTSGGVYEVMPLAAGRISEVRVRVGDQVSAGHLVARMEQPELTERLHQAKVALAALEAQHRDLLAFSTEGEALQNTQLERQRVAARQIIASARKTLAWEARKLQQQKQLVADGLLLRQTLLDTQQRHNAARERVSEAESQLAQLEVRDLEQRNQLQTSRFASEVKLTEAKRMVDELTRELTSKTEITSRYTGRILEVLSEQGRMVASGEAILRLDESGKGARKLNAVIYVPSGYGKQIKPGMPILVSPTTVKQEEFGQLVARVTYVSDFPATPRGMQRTLKNEQLVQSLARGDAPFEVHAELLLDPNTPSGFRWSSSKGPPSRIEGGTMATASIEVDHRRPIELVVPLIREWSGI
jgi:HlyD family secretion protein